MRIGILGSGNVANAFAAAFSPKFEIKIYARNGRKAMSISKKYGCTYVAKLEELFVHVDIVLLCVNDDSIFTVSSQIPTTYDGIVAHTSGSSSLYEIKDGKYTKASFYPLQTIRKNAPISFDDVPICITTKDKSSTNKLKKIARSINGKIYLLTDDDKTKIHVAAVMMNNFVNHLAVLSKEYLDKNKLPYEILLPLIAETYKKIGLSKLDLTQTGPAARGDIKTIQKHLSLLKDNPKMRSIYRIITQSILETNAK